MDSWVGFDLDGTLAHYGGWRGVEHIGKPIKPMVDLLIDYIKAGQKVKIFTARTTIPEGVVYVKNWLLDNNLPDLEVTNIKDFGMITLYDDRCVQVEVNTGKLVEYIKIRPAPKFIKTGDKNGI